MKNKVIKSLSFILALFMCISFAVPVGAVKFIDGYPNTHRNSGQNIADLIAVSKTQIGYTELNTSTGFPIQSGYDGGYTKYGASFGDPTGPWCAYFVSWCATQAGIPTSVIPRLGNCNSLISWYKNRSRFYYRSSGYIPKTGDLAFFNWSGGTSARHIGIITGVSGNRFYTIEGNTDNSIGYRCAAKTRTISSSYVVGYATPNYNDASTYVGSYSFASSVSGNSGSQSDSIAYSTSKLAVITTSATNITSSNATLNGGITNGGYLKISSSGFYFGTDKNSMTKYPASGATSKKKINLSMDIGKKVSGLKPNTTYYYRAYTNIDGRDYIGPTYAVVTVDDQPQQLVLSESNMNVGIGQTAEIMSAQLPVGSRDEGVTWKSSDEKIAQVNSDGVVTGVSFGAVTITAKTNYGEISAKCEVDVLISAPERVLLVNSAKDEITVKWSTVSGATGYVLYRSEELDGDFEEYKTFDSDEISFVDKNVETGNRYYYRIMTKAKLEKYNSDISDTLYTTARLATPEITDIQQTEMNNLSITWTEVEDAKQYIVYRCERIDGLYLAIGTTTKTNMTDMGLAEKSYFYKVVADDGNEKEISDFSPIVGSSVKAKLLQHEIDPIAKMAFEIATGSIEKSTKKIEEQSVFSKKYTGVKDSII